MTKRFGFTLAEVLITLGIIGVVAAMTIPTLIANTNGAKFRSQFKKTVSTLNQAGLMGQAQFEYDYASAVDACSGTPSSDNPNDSFTFCALLNGTLTGQTALGTVADIKMSAAGTSGKVELQDYVKKITGGGTVDSRGVIGSAPYTNIGDFIAYQLADGSIVAFADGARAADDAAACELDLGSSITSAWITGHPLCVGFIDVNGTTLPNKEVICSNADSDVVLVGGAALSDTSTADCVVKNDANSMTDIFPIVFHDATVEPASNAAKYVLTTAK